MLTKAALLSAASLVIAMPAIAQNTPTGASGAERDVIVIEGSRLNQTATEVGSSVSVITADDIEELGFDFVIDALAAAPGVSVNANGPFGGVATVRIRGAASEQTLVLIDGVPVNDPSAPGGGFDFARLDTENIERIEVLKGPQSTLWGTDAVGGVVSITTKRPGEGFGGSAFGEYGSFNTFRGGASVENANDVGDFRLAVVGTTSDGISKADEDNANIEDDAYEAVTVSARGGLNLGGDVRVEAGVLWSDTQAEFDVFSASAQGGVADGDAVSDTEEVSGDVSLTGSAFGGRLENLALVGYSQIQREDSGADAFPFQIEGERVIARYQGTLNIDERNTLAFGAERDETEVDGEDIAINGVFGLYEAKPTQTLTLTGGVRVDDHETFGSETTGRVAAAYNPTSNLTVRASWGQGFKAPTLNQLSGGGFALPNPDLQPETSQAFDVGVDWRSGDGRFDAGVTVFDNDIEDLIRFAPDGYFNEPEVETRGVEVTGGAQLTDTVRVSGAYTYLDTEDGDGERLSRLPEHAGDVRLSYDPPGPFSGAVLVRFNGEEINADGTTLDSWTRVDVAASYAVNDSVEVFARVENLFDEDYQQILGYGTADLSGSIGVRVRY